MKQQKGSAHVVIVSILVVALIGALGFTFWQNFINKDDGEKTVEAASSVKEENMTTEEAAKPAYEGVYTTGGNFQVKIPNGWTVEAGAYDGYVGSQLALLAGPNQLDTLKYDQATQPVINQTMGFGWDGLTEHFYIISQEPSPLSTDGYVKTTFELEDGTKGDKYVRVLRKEDQQQRDSFTKAADSYTFTMYEFKDGDVNVRAYLNYYSNTSFDVDLGENVVKSIRL